MQRIFTSRLYAIFLILFLIVFGAILLANSWVSQVAKNKIFSHYDDIEPQQTVLVLGAGVKTNGQPSDILADRLETAIDLYIESQAAKIIVSGDNSTEHYNETDTMRDYLLANSIPPKVIFTDYAGFDTFDSIYRAKEIFGADKLVIVSQEFHLLRAIFLAEKLGIEAVGFSADLHEYRDRIWLNLREIPANTKAAANILFNSKPHFLGEKFDLTGDGTASWADPIMQ